MMEVFTFDGQSAPKSVQQVKAPEDEVFTGAVPLGDRVLVMLRRPSGKSSALYQVWTLGSATYTASVSSELSTLDYAVYYIHPLLKANQKVSNEADMQAYTNTVPGTKVKYAMVPIKGGDFVMGTKDSEEGRQPSEGPQHKVQVAPFWMGKCEVSWDEYTLFMYPDEEHKFKDTLPTDPKNDEASGACARPSKPYTEMSFGMGRDGFPAIAMTHHAASKYCQWLSAKTGHFYRLPTEAEWEYACRAGTTTAYSFGDDPALLKDYAWFEENSDFKYQKVGRKKPNPWGLHDMHGNVLEWCLDGYEDNYAKYTAPLTANPWTRATRPYPHVARGGSYDDEPTRLRSAARRGSDRAWKMQDPQLPKSVWWLSDAPWVGFRLVRPLQVPAPEELTKCWNSGTERD
jgi:formylglycine-generating enzyme required for sulfatase activity